MKKIILALALLGSLAVGKTIFTKELVEELEQKCEEGYFKACGAVGLFYGDPAALGGDISDINYDKKLYFYKKACDEREYVACSNIGAMYFKGEGVEKDYKKAMELFTKACDNGVAAACNGLGYMYASSLGVRVDRTKAMRYYKMACDGGDWVGCGNLAESLEENGYNVEAARYYKKACKLGKNEDPFNLMVQNFCDK